MSNLLHDKNSTKFEWHHARPVTLNSFILILLCFLVPPANAVDERPKSAKNIRQQNEQILTSSEFRHLRWVKQQQDAASQFPSSPGSGSGGGGKENGSDGKGSPSDGGEKSTTSPPPSTDRSSSFPDMSGGASALGDAFSALLTGLFWVVVAVVVGVMIYFIGKAMLDYKRPEQELDSEDSDIITTEEPERAPGEIPPDAYVARALELNQSGQHAEAIGHLMLGAMSKAENLQLIRFRRGLTFRDYLRSLSEHQNSYRAFRQIMRVYEPIWFGRRPASAQHFEATLSSYKSGFVTSFDVV